MQFIFSPILINLIFILVFNFLSFYWLGVSLLLGTVADNRFDLLFLRYSQIRQRHRKFLYDYPYTFELTALLFN